MNDHASDPTDELLGAYLDDIATADERAIVDADPQLLARLGELRAVARAVADVSPVESWERESSILAALHAFDELAVGIARPGQPAEELADTLVVPMSMHSTSEIRRPRRHRAWATGRWMGAAAALLLIVAGIGVLADDDGGGDDAGVFSAATETTVGGGLAESNAALPDAAAEQDASAASDTIAAAEAADQATTLTEITGGAAVEPKDEGDGTSTAAEAVPGSLLPELDNDADLLNFVSSLPTGRVAVPAERGVPACAGAGLGGDDVGEVLWQGTPAHVILQPDASTPTEALVVDVECVLLVGLLLD